MNETFCSRPIISLLFEIPRSDTKTKYQLIKNALNQLLVKLSKNTFYSYLYCKQFLFDISTVPASIGRYCENLH